MHLEYVPMLCGGTGHECATSTVGREGINTLSRGRLLKFLLLPTVEVRYIVCMYESSGVTLIFVSLGLNILLPIFTGAKFEIY